MTHKQKQQLIEFLDIVEIFIRENYRKNFMVKQIISMCLKEVNFNFPHTKIVKYFTLIKGMPIKTFQDEFRLVDIKHILKTTDQSLFSIALMFHFEDESGLINFFKRKEGITPEEYRINNKSVSVSVR